MIIADPMHTIGDRLRHYAITQCGTLKCLAEELSMAPANLSKYVRGKNEPGVKLLRTLARHGMNVHWLITGEGRMLAGESRESGLNQEDQALLAIVKSVGFSEEEQLRTLLLDVRRLFDAQKTLRKKLVNLYRDQTERKKGKRDR
jgi:transcriptional regulator with XRE-family HTH domain